jgi:hypothetical protein
VCATAAAARHWALSHNTGVMQFVGLLNLDNDKHTGEQKPFIFVDLYPLCRQKHRQ